MKPKAKPPTQTAIAAAIGVVPSRVVALRMMGMPIDSIDAAVRWHTANVRPMPNKRTRDEPAVPGRAQQHRRAHVRDAPQASAFHQARAAREVYEAKLAQLRYEVEVGKLVNADALRAVLAKQVVTFRDRLLRMPDHLAVVLIGLSDARVRALIEGEVRDALAALDAGAINGAAP
jgi:hypothetical protein